MTKQALSTKASKRLAGLTCAALAGCLFVTPASAESRTLGKIAETGAITIGVRDQSVPFSYMDDNQKPIGYSIDICMHVVDAIKAKLNKPNLEIKTQPATPATRIALIGNGTIDMECSTGTNNAARQKQVSFSNTIFLTANTFAAKKASNIQSLDDLKGKTVAAPAGSANLQQLNELNVNKNMGMRILPAKDMGEGFLMLSTDRISALISDDVLLASFIATSASPDAYILSKENIAPPEPYAIMFAKDDTEFKAVVDKAVADFFASPAAKENYARWFLKAIPPRGIVMNVPMSPALEKAYAHPTDSIDPASYR